MKVPSIFGQCMSHSLRHGLMCVSGEMVCLVTDTSLQVSVCFLSYCRLLVTALWILKSIHVPKHMFGLKKD